MSQERGASAPPRTGRVGARRLLGAAGAGVLVSGVIVQIYLAIVARALTPAEYATFGSFWAIALVLGFGAFLPLEQQLAQRLALPGDRRPVLRAAATAALALAGVALVVLLASFWVIRPALDGNVSAYLALGVLCVVSAGQFLLRGTLIGTDRLVRHAAVMVLDALLRLGFAVLVFLLTGSAAAFCWALVLAIAAAHLPGLPAVWRRAARTGARTDVTVGEPVRGRDLVVASVPLLVGSSCAQLLLNGLPVIVVATAAEDQAAAGVFVAAFTLAKAPLSMIVPLQSAVVPTLTRLIASGRRSEVVRLLAKGAAALLAAAAVGVPLAWIVGPRVITLIYGEDYTIAGTDLSLIALGVLSHIALVVLTQVHVARGRHRDVGLSWAVALGTAAAAFALIPGAILAAEVAFALGSAAGAVASCVILAAARRSTTGSAQEDRREGP